MNWGFLLFRGSYTYKKGLIVQSSLKTTQLLDPLLFYFLMPGSTALYRRGMMIKPKIKVGTMYVAW